MTKLVRDLMNPGIMTCWPDASLGQIAVMLAERHVHALFVADRRGRPIGIITDFDLLAGEWLSADQESLTAMRSLTAGDLMSTPIHTVAADEPAVSAARRMRDELIRRLMVVDKGRPVGVISVSDFIRDLASRGKPSRETVGDVMSDAMLVCRDKTTVLAAARAMADTGWRSVLVLSAAGKALGVFSGLDLLKYCQIDDCPDTTLVTEVMHPALTIEITASLHEAAKTMIEAHHHRLIVVDPEQPDAIPLGVISSFDIVAAMAHPDSVWQQ
ncbi:MAG TPA: CBS domain-containing protein [Anaerolineales bacterium]